MRMTGQPQAQARRLWLGRLNPLHGLAAAAIVLLGFGVSYHYFSKPSNPSNPAIPVTLASDLISRHDSCCSLPDHHGIKDDDFDQIAKEMGVHLGIPVMAAKLDGTWTFHGASYCPVGDLKSGHISAHLVFARDKQFVSLFSLPASVLNNVHIQSTSEMEQNHPLAAFQTSHGFYCVVGSSPDGSLTIEQVRVLRDQVQPKIAAADEDQPDAHETLAEFP